MKDYTVLYDTLNNLYLKIREEILAFKNAGGLIKIPYQEVKAIKIDYKMGTFMYDWQNICYYEVYDWKSLTFSEFLEKTVKGSAECLLAADEICSVFDVPEDA